MVIANNTINRVLVQNVEGLWVYDDSKYGVEKQPLVFGADCHHDEGGELARALLGVVAPRTPEGLELEFLDLLEVRGREAVGRRVVAVSASERDRREAIRHSVAEWYRELPICQERTRTLARALEGVEDRQPVLLRYLVALTAGTKTEH